MSKRRYGQAGLTYMSETYLNQPVVQAAIQERIAAVRSYKQLSAGDSFPIEWDLDELTPNGLKHMIGPSDLHVKESSSTYLYSRRRVTTDRSG